MIDRQAGQLYYYLMVRHQVPALVGHAAIEINDAVCAMFLFISLLWRLFSIGWFWCGCMRQDVFFIVFLSECLCME